MEIIPKQKNENMDEELGVESLQITAHGRRKKLDIVVFPGEEKARHQARQEKIRLQAKK